MIYVLQRDKVPVVRQLFTSPEEVTAWLRHALAGEGLILEHVDYTWVGSELAMGVFCTDKKARHAIEGLRLAPFVQFYGSTFRPAEVPLHPQTIQAL